MIRNRAVDRNGQLGSLVGCVAVMGLNLGNGTFGPAVDHDASVAPQVVTLGDFNGDGQLDLAVANQGDPNSYASKVPGSEVSIMLNQHGGTFGAAVNYFVGNWPNSLSTADLNGDGKLDLAIGAQTNLGSTTISILLNPGGGVFGAAILYKTAYPPNAIALGDVDGDGKLDLIVGTIHGMISVLLNQGNATFGPPIDYSGGTFSIAVADLDSDGALDLATAGGAAVVMLNRCLP